MVCIIIRHANDEEINPLHRHDPSIKHRDKYKCKKLSKKLIDKYGYPDLIYCSPMKRTRDTLKYMTNGMKTEIKYDNRLSRYFVSYEKKNPSLFTVTKEFNLNIGESYRDFKKRCDDFLRHIRKHNYIRSDKVVWVITHTLVLKRFFRKRHIYINPYIKFLQYNRLK